MQSVCSLEDLNAGNEHWWSVMYCIVKRRTILIGTSTISFTSMFNLGQQTGFSHNKEMAYGTRSS